MPVTIDGTLGITTPMYNGAITANAVTPSVNMKSRIINGAMVIDQRNAGASVSVTTSNIFGVDRWKFDDISPSTYTVQRSSVAPAGFSFSSLITVGTGAASTADSYVRIIQNIEGFNTADLGWGTANAQTVTVSFWVRSSIAGTYCFGLQNATTNYSYPVNYTINSANTWEYKTITVIGPTAGTWIGATNGIGILCTWDLGSGSNWNGTNAIWQNGNTWKTSSQTAFTATSGATFYITGVQLEVGSTATSFDYRPYGTELQLCQRYYQQINGNASVGTAAYGMMGSGIVFNSTSADISIPLKVSMRTTPTLTQSATTIQVGGTLYATTSIGDAGSTPNVLFVRVGNAGTMTVGYGAILISNNNTSGYFAMSAEL